MYCLVIFPSRFILLYFTVFHCIYWFPYPLPPMYTQTYLFFRVWMLTVDKLETTTSIAVSSRLVAWAQPVFSFKQVYFSMASLHECGNDIMRVCVCVFVCVFVGGDTLWSTHWTHQLQKEKWISSHHNRSCSWGRYHVIHPHLGCLPPAPHCRDHSHLHHHQHQPPATRI